MIVVWSYESRANNEGGRPRSPLVMVRRFDVLSTNRSFDLHRESMNLNYRQNPVYPAARFEGEEARTDVPEVESRECSRSKPSGWPGRQEEKRGLCVEATMVVRSCGGCMAGKWRMRGRRLER